MNSFGDLVLAVCSTAIFLIALLGWQLLRQNGRILLRLDELEKRLNELEFGEGDEPQSLPLGSEAPSFELPDLSGGRTSLAQFLGQPVLLIFFNPDCGFCREMMPRLAGLSPHLAGRGEAGGNMGEGTPRVLVLSTGDVKQNRQLFAEHKVDLTVLLQEKSEVATAYRAQGTPSGYLISAEGKIASALAMGAEALLKLAVRAVPLTPALSPSDGAREKNGTGDDGRANRFSQRSVARSKIKRDGLKAGTAAPDFRLPRLDGRGDLTLSELRGQRVLLVFSSPGCGPCNELAPELEKFHRDQSDRDRSPVAARGHGDEIGTFNRRREVVAAADGDRPRSEGIAVIMISKGEPKENRAKVKEYDLTFPIVLQQQWEISRRYAMFATPIAYLISEAGVIVHDVAVGADAISDLLASMDGASEISQSAPSESDGRTALANQL